MRYGGGFRALAALLLLGFIGLIAAGAYGAGFAAGNTSPAFTPAPPAWAYGGAFGFGHFVGFLVTILIFIIVVRLILAVIFGGHRRHGPWGHPGYWQGPGDPAQFGAYGPRGGWHRGPWQEVGQPYFDEFHRRAHAEPTAAPPAGANPAAGAGAAGDQPR